MASLQLVYLSAFLLLQHCPWIVPVAVSTDRPVVEVQEHKDAVLSCLFRTEKDHSPRIEWKKVQRKDVSFVYYNGEFVGDFKGRANITGATVTLHQVTVQDTGDYRCEVSAPLDTKNLGETNITLNVLVPPNVPMCEIPSSALTGTVVELRCEDVHSVPPATYSWYKDGKPLPQFSLQDSRPANATFTQNPRTGTLQFNPVSRTDTGKYHCVANNGVGDPKSCIGKHMQIDDLNVSGIVAAVVVVFLVVSLCGLGVCYAHRQGYFNRDLQSDTSEYYSNYYTYYRPQYQKGHRGRSFWIPQCHGVTHISSQNLHRTDDMNGAGYGIPPQEDFKHAQSFML